MPHETRLVQRAYKFALDPTPEQAAQFASHAGGARFAFNWGIATYAAALNARQAQKDAGQRITIDLPDHFTLCKLWTAYKDTYRDTPDPDGRTTHWVENNFVGTYQAALRDAHGAWQKMWDSRAGRRKGRAVGRPRFKKKGRSQDSFQMHGDTLRIDTGSAVRPVGAPRVKRRPAEVGEPWGHALRRLTDSARKFYHERRDRKGFGCATPVGVPNKRGWVVDHPCPGAVTHVLTYRAKAVRRSDPTVVDRTVAHKRNLCDEHAAGVAQERGIDLPAEAKKAGVTGYGPAASTSGSRYMSLPKVGQVKIPGKLRIGQRRRVTPTPGETQWVDRSARVARKLARLLRRSETAGPVVCPTCNGTGEVQVTTKAGEPKTSKCGVYGPHVAPDDKRPGCRGSGKVEQARIVRATLSRGASGTWWCSVTAEVVMQVRTAPSKRQTRNGVVGLDLGVRHLAVASTGDTYTNSRFLDANLADLRRLQKALSRAEKDSKRREKAKRRVGALHEQVALMRKDACDRITSEMANTYAKVGVEGWDAQRLAEKGSEGVPVRLRKARNRALADAAPGMFRWQLTYKTSWCGSQYNQGEPHWETGRICSVCGRVRTKPVPLTEEQFRCDGGHVVDRRVNSARVMEKVTAGLIAPPGVVDEPRGGDVRPVTPRRDGRSPAKRAARTRKRGKAGTPDP